MRSWMSRTLVAASIGCSFLLFGAALYLLRDFLFHFIIRTQLPLSPTARSYELWKDTKNMPTYMDIYLFNWTNPEEIMDHTKKPNLNQLGPYSFRERREKVNVTFHPENGTVTYQQKRTWWFDEGRSKGSLNDKISQLNVVAVSAAHKVRYWPFVMQQSFSYLLNQFSNEINVVKTADELLFKGFEDKLITLGQMSGMEEGEAPPFDKFGWFYMRNGSTDFDGYSNIGTGMGDLSSLGAIKNWNFQDKTAFYKSPCNVIEGSGGEFWPPYRKKEDIRLFTPDICRPVTYEFEDEVDHKGIHGYKFSMGDKTLSNDTRRRYPHEVAKYIDPTTTTEDFFVSDPTTKRSINEDEDPDVQNIGQCFCNGDCSPKGVINITACRYGAPGFISLPHFHKGDPMLRDSFVGLAPNDKDHSFYLTLEPTTGIPIDVKARLQVNILLQPSKIVDLFKKVPTLYFPMFWFSVEAGIPDDMVGGMKLLLELPTLCMYAGLIMMFLGSLILCGVSVSCFVYNRRRVPLKQLQKTEMMYMNKSDADEDGQIRNDCRLYPNLREVEY
ncbi:hypothetical protein TKK_0010127 [Trichogramma kaykai]|uniref:Uncharacterized protein n=1 Tax=Trichogramma kaykai TaxID=54128 RepID=A0ABD2WYC1_9HYME